MEIEVGEYISRKEYIKKYNSEVGYALYIQHNIKKDDYVRLITGQIVKVIGVKENNVDKKAIYYGIYDCDWFNSMAAENFSNNIEDLIELGDCLKIKDDEIYQVIFDKSYEKLGILIPNKNELAVRHCSINYIFSKEGIKEFEKVSIATKQQFESIEYKLEEENE